jgi:GDPmannose 4,6-dehydratase
LLAKGCEVHGLVQGASTFGTDRIDNIYQDLHDPAARLFFHYGDLSNDEQLTNLIYNVKPVEICHLGARSYVRVSG